jgi:hypothetical protein
MSPEELRDATKQRPFEAFRVVMSDGVAFEIYHPDLLMVGQRTAVIGLVGDPAHEFYDRTIKIDLGHVVRLEPMPSTPPPATFRLA